MKNEYPGDFELFWRNYPKTPVMSKKEAFMAWQKSPPEEWPKILTATPLYEEWLRQQRWKKPDYPAVHACRFISQRRYEGFCTTARPSTPELSSRVYLRFGCPQLEAWDRYMVLTRGRQLPRDRNGGWWVEAEWPPKQEAMA